MYAGLVAKPSAGTPADPFSPLRQGLAWFVPLSEGGGSQLSDVIGGVNLTASGSPSWVPGSSQVMGGGLAFTSSSQYAPATIPAPLKLAPPVTLVFGYRSLGAASASATIFAVPLNNTNTSPFAAWSMYCASATSIGMFAAGGASVYSQTGTIFTPTVGVDYVIAAVFAVATYTLISVPVNGGTPAVATGSWVHQLNPIYTSTALIELGQSGSTPNCRLYFAGIYARALSIADTVALAQNPWQVLGWPRWQTPFTPPPPKSYFIRPPRQPVRAQPAIQAKSPGGNPKVKPKPPAVTLAKPPLKTLWPLLYHTRYVPTTIGFPARYVTIPWRKPVRGGTPISLRQSGLYAPPIALNLQAWAAKLLSSDSDPLAVDASQATIVD